jgi:hypothetical protein
MVIASFFHPRALQGGEWSGETSIMPRKRSRVEKDRPAPIMKWKAKNKHFFLQNHAKVVSACFHAGSGLLSIGFDSGIFGIWEMPDFTNIQTLRYLYVCLSLVSLRAKSMLSLSIHQVNGLPSDPQLLVSCLFGNGKVNLMF